MNFNLDNLNNFNLDNLNNLNSTITNILDSNITGKKRKRNVNSSNSILGGNPMDKMLKNIFGAIAGPPPVALKGNHIYFRSGVTTETGNMLIDIINKINEEYELQVNVNSTVYVMPKPYYLHINSHGGNLYTGFSLYDAIRNSTVPIYTVVERYAISAGSLMFMAGKRRFMTENSRILIHQLSQFKYGDETFHNMEDNFINAKQEMENIIAIYIENQYTDNIDKEHIFTSESLQKILSHDLMWDYNTCCKYGLIDDLYINKRQVEERDLRDFQLDMFGLKTKAPPTIRYHQKIELNDELTNILKERLEQIQKENEKEKGGLPFPFNLEQIIAEDVEANKKQKEMETNNTESEAETESETETDTTELEEVTVIDITTKKDDKDDKSKSKPTRRSSRLSNK